LIIGEKVLNEAYQRLGINMQIKKFPAERALYTSNSGLVDGELCRVEGLDKTYTNLIRIPVAVSKVEHVIFSKSSNYITISMSQMNRLFPKSQKSSGKWRRREESRPFAKRLFMN